MIALFPTIRGAYGHHDQSPKPCPGLTANMKSIFEGVGGHGVFAGGNNVGLHVTLPKQPIVGSLAIPIHSDAIRVADGHHYTTASAATRPAIPASLTAGLSGTGFLVDLDGDELHFVRDTEPVTWTPAENDQAVHDATKAAAVAAVEAIP